MNSDSTEVEREDKLSCFLIRSPTTPQPPTLAEQPLFCSNTRCMQIKKTRQREVTASEVTASDKPGALFDMQGAWIAICAGAEAHPKQKEIFPECSQPGWGTWVEEETKATGAGTRARSSVGEWRPSIIRASRSSYLSPLAQNSALWKRRSCFWGFCASPSVRFLYLLYRNHVDKSPASAARLTQSIPTIHNRAS